MGSRALFEGPSRKGAEPSSVLQPAAEALARLSKHTPRPVESLPALKFHYANDCRTYYSVAALSRRKVLDEEHRRSALALLFRLRSSLERAIISDLDCSGPREDFLDTWASRSFFGCSSKQGVSVRYALASCVPTVTCGGGCYAHDGQDPKIHAIFRGALNYFIGRTYERLEPHEGARLFDRLQKAIEYGVNAARKDQEAAAQAGYRRAPRIRFSHVGEMAATPRFTNELARRVHLVDPEVACVIYTRHPRAKDLDGSSLIINFTLEGDHDPRASWAPPSARIVASAWDGHLSSIAEVNFLEHHVGEHQQPVGAGTVCPVTENHALTRSCDGARCQLCFVPTAPDRVLLPLVALAEL
jgi:hypothetical protein